MKKSNDLFQGFKFDVNIKFLVKKNLKINL